MPEKASSFCECHHVAQRSLFSCHHGQQRRDRRRDAARARCHSPHPDTDTAIPFTLTDMGCADGGTSIDLVRQATAAVRGALDPAAPPAGWELPAEFATLRRVGRA
jgi:hypothetical protein